MNVVNSVRLTPNDTFLNHEDSVIKTNHYEEIFFNDHSKIPNLLSNNKTNFNNNNVQQKKTLSLNQIDSSCVELERMKNAEINLNERKVNLTDFFLLSLLIQKFLKNRKIVCI